MRIIVDKGFYSCVLSCDEFSCSPSWWCGIGVPCLDDELGVQCFAYEDIPIILIFGVDGGSPCAGIDGLRLIIADPIWEVSMRA